MKHRIRKLTSLLLSLSLISALTLPAAASNALGEDLFAKDTLLHQETQLSTNVFWSTTYSDLRTENLITYTPNKAVTPIVTYGDALTDRSSVADTAALLEDDGYRVVAGINGDFYNVSTGLLEGLGIGGGGGAGGPAVAGHRPRMPHVPTQQRRQIIDMMVCRKDPSCHGSLTSFPG